MRASLRIVPSILLALTLAGPLATGCRRTVVVNDDAQYRQWEQETHREHREAQQRTEDERRQYDEWRKTHERR